MRRTRLFAAVAVFFTLVLRVPLGAHDIPRDVTVHAFVKPEGNRLRVLLRVPLGAMRDIQFPQRPDGNLDVPHATQSLRDAVTHWILSTLDLREADVPLQSPGIAALRVSLPSDRSFASYGTALAHVTAGTPGDPQLPWNQALLDVLVEYPIASERSAYSIRPGFERLGVNVVTVLRFVHVRQASGGQVTPEYTIRAFELRGDPGLVRLDPRWHQAAWTFVKLGFMHILDGVDHLLFLVCLVIPFRRLRPLILVVTAFTVAHSITLIAAASGLAPDALWFPPLVETLIAASIVYLALENIVTSGTTARRWAVAFGFGLVHGFGFSFALKETMQFAGSHLLASLLAFNVGVEIGQVLVLAALVPAFHLLFRFGIRERIGTIVLSALVAHTAWHWMTDRWDALRQFPGSAIEAPGLFVVRLLLVVVGVMGAAWLAKLALSQLAARPSGPRDSRAAPE